MIFDLIYFDFEDEAVYCSQVISDYALCFLKNLTIIIYVKGSFISPYVINFHRMPICNTERDKLFET